MTPQDAYELAKALCEWRYAVDARYGFKPGDRGYTNMAEAHARYLADVVTEIPECYADAAVSAARNGGYCAA